MSLADRSDVARPATTATYTPPFSVGGIFYRAVTLFGWYFILAIMVGGASFLSYAFVYLTGWDYAFPIRALFPGLGIQAAQYFRLSTLLSFLFQTFDAALTVAAAWQRLNDQAIRLRFVIGRALRSTLPLVLIRFGPTFGLTTALVLIYSDDWARRAIGFFVFAVPSVFVALIWFVAPSVNILERRSVIESCRRSAALTRGHRWKLFGIFLILSVPYLTMQFAVLRLYYAYGVNAYVGACFLLTGVYAALSCIVAVTIYYHLRSAKDGLGNDRIATVFD